MPELLTILLIEWTLKEVQKFIEQVEKATSILEKGYVDFKTNQFGTLHVAVISSQVSIYYRIQSKSKVEIIRIWDNRQNPSKLIK
jgi:hypothetical protein